MEEASCAEQYLKSGKQKTLKCSKSSKQAHDPVSYLPDFKYIESRMEGCQIPEALVPNKEWCSKMVLWFAHVRQCSFLVEDQAEHSGSASVICSIENGMLPTTADIRGNRIALDVATYFEKKAEDFLHSDLAWIFASLAAIDRLLTPQIASVLQNIADKIVKQVSKLALEDPLIPFLMVVFSIITKYFHQP
jgi:hypothetical protein